jgi:hypothetical protein
MGALTDWVLEHAIGQCAALNRDGVTMTIMS